MSEVEHKPAVASREEETMSLDAFTNKEPLHHSPNDLIEPEIVEDGWELSLPSGFVSSRPNNTEWPVIERLIYNFTQHEFDHYKAVQHAIEDQQSLLSRLHDAPKTALVLGATGLVGERLVELLAQRGARRIVAFDRAEAQDKVKTFADVEVQYSFGNIESIEFMSPLFQDVDVVFNCYDLSPFLGSKNLYERVIHNNVAALLNLAEESNVKKWVQLTTPATRIPPSQHGLWNASEITLEQPGSFEYDNDYFRTKALSEIVVQEKNSEKMMTICIAPHLVYGTKLSNTVEGDHFLLPQLLKSSVKGDLRVFGEGDNKVDICHVDNAAHALILASAKMVRFDQAPAGNFYIITDELQHSFWGIVDDLIVRGGCESLKTRIKAPAPLVRVAGFLSKVLNPAATLNPHLVNISQHHRTFNIDAARNELGYVPMTFWKDDWVNICQEILSRNNLPCYNTRFYYEGVQFEGFSAELNKVDAETRRQERLAKQQEAARLAEELAVKQAAKKAQEEADNAREEEEKKNQISPDVEAVIEEQPVVIAPVVVAPVVEEVVVAPVVEEVAVVQEEAPSQAQEEEEEEIEVAPASVVDDEVAPASVVDDEVAPASVVDDEVVEGEEQQPAASNNGGKKGKKGKKH